MTTLEDYSFGPKGRCRHCGEEAPGHRVCGACDNNTAHILEARARRDEAEALEKRLRESGLPTAYRSGRLSLATFEASSDSEAAALDFASAWADGTASHRWGYIHGGVGTRKTGLAASALCEMIRAGRPGRFISFPELGSEVKASFGRHGESELEIIGRYKRIHGLVIDDLGVGHPTAFTTEAPHRLQNDRNEERPPPLFTSNLKLADLGQHFAVAGNETTGERIVDRIRGLAIRVQLSGESHRRSPARGDQHTSSSAR